MISNHFTDANLSWIQLAKASSNARTVQEHTKEATHG